MRLLTIQIGKRQKNSHIAIREMSDKIPCIIIIFGLPGTGKTTFARLLAHKLQLRHFNTDMIRTAIGRRQQYSDNSKSMIYDEILLLTRKELSNGKSVIVDGTFYRESLRQKFKVLANEMESSIKWIEICADPETVKKWISKKRTYSEADFSVYQIVQSEFDPIQEPYIKLYSDKEELSILVKKAIEYISNDQ